MCMNNTVPIAISDCYVYVVRPLYIQKICIHKLTAYRSGVHTSQCWGAYGECVAFPIMPLYAQLQSEILGIQDYCRPHNFIITRVSCSYYKLGFNNGSNENVGVTDISETQSEEFLGFWTTVLVDSFQYPAGAVCVSSVWPKL